MYFRRLVRTKHPFRLFVSKHIKQIVACAIALMLLSTVLIFALVPTHYSSCVTLAVINRLSDESHTSNSTLLLIESHNLASLFVSLYSGHEVVEQVRQQMGWQDMEDDDILNKISVERPERTILVNVYARDVDPQVAKQLAQVYADTMRDILTEPLSINNVETLRTATEPTQVSNRPLYLLIALPSCWIVIFLITAVVFRLRTRLSEEYQIEHYPYAVLGRIPYMPECKETNKNAEKEATT